MSYEAEVRLIDKDGGDFWKDKGDASKVISKALNYLEKKQSIGVWEKIRYYLREDFRLLNMAIYDRKNYQLEIQSKKEQEEKDGD